MEERSAAYFEPCVFSDEAAEEFPEAARRAAEAGATQLEIRNRLFGKKVTEIDDADADRILSVCEEYGLGVGSLGSPVGKCSPDNPEEGKRHAALFERMLRLSDLFDCPIIRGFSLWAPNRGRDWDRDLGPYMERIAEFLLPKARLAAERGVVLALENEMDTLLGSCAEGRRLMEFLGDPDGLGLVWDVGNSASVEPPYPDGYELIEPWIVHVHVKPNAEGTASPLPGSENVTLEEALSRLWNDGYEGCISVEHFPGPEKTIRATREVADVIASIKEASRRARD